MKKTAVILIGIIIAVILLHAFRASHTSLIKGRMNVNSPGSRIVARQGKDSVKTSVSPDGSFRITLTKGQWQLQLEQFANDQLIQHTLIDTMMINEQQDIDLGEIPTGL